MAASCASSRACSAAGPSAASLRRASARTSAGISGITASPWVSARRYIPVPPHRIGRRAAAIASSAASRQRATLPASAAGHTP
jgi:hypothetical protein